MAYLWASELKPYIDAIGITLVTPLARMSYFRQGNQIMVMVTWVLITLGSYTLKRPMGYSEY